MKPRRNPKFDEKDRVILKILARDARTSLRDIALEVGLSSPSVRARLDKLRKFFTPTILFEFEKVGLARYFISLTLHHGIPSDSKQRIVERIKNEPEVYAIWETSGRQDIVVHVLFASTRELVDFVEEKLRPMSEIASVETCEIVRSYTDIWVTHRTYYEVMKKYEIAKNKEAT